jgi:hypothetical protein
MRATGRPTSTPAGNASSRRTRPDFHAVYAADLLGSFDSPAKAKKLGGLTLDGKIESDTLSLLARAPGLMSVDAKKAGVGMFGFGKAAPMYQSNYLEEARGGR